MDPQILATFFSGGTLVSVIVGLMKLGGMQQMLKTHAESIAAHASRMDRYEQEVRGVAARIERVVGRLEARDGRVREGD
jgi:hypothetical protein